MEAVKMSDFTTEQNEIIDAFGSNMLVSASAGSGKTKVLIAKIKKILTDEMAKVKDLLVVTFTNAACDEIKQRLQKAIIESKNEKLYEQIDDLSTCDILTFDAFCKKVIEEFGYQIAINSGFGIADGNLSSFLKNKALDNLIAKHNDLGDQQFSNLINIFFEKRNDKKFRETIISIHNFVINHKSFDEYIKILDSIYSQNLQDSLAIKYLNNYFEEIKQNFENELKQLVLSAEMLGEQKLQDGFSKTLENLSKFSSDYLSNLRYYFDGFGFETIRSSKNDIAEVCELKEQYKKQKDIFKKNTEKVFCADLKNLDNEQILKYLEQDKVVISNLLSFAKEFDQEYKSLKKTYNVLDFVDLENYDYQILKNSSIKNALRDKYKYIFIDEYQDTSKLQNDIIDLFAKNDNMIMVGDVKQSIYRYRNAEPDIFLKKYDAYKSKEKSVFELNKNFRSEKKILQFTNFVFDLIMQKDIDGIDYQKTSDLQFGEVVPSCNGENFVDVIVIDNQKQQTLPEPFEKYSVKNAKLVFDDSSKIENEALVAANKIVDFVKTKKYYNVDKKTFEPITYADIAILTRDQKDIILNVRKVLNKCGIPVRCKFDENISDNFDTKLLISILHLIENMRDDNSLLTVMSSIVGNFTFDQIVEIRQFDRDIDYFYEAVKNYAEKNDNEISIKINNLYKKIDYYRIVANSMDICELLSHIVQREQLDKYFWLNDYGKQFDEHLRLLLSSYQSIKEYSLSEFVAYIDSFAKEVVTTQIADSENAVTISTIHASKGLEYPVVFLLQCGKEFALRPETIYCDSEFGFSKQSVDLVDRTKIENPIVASFKLKTLEEQKKDEKRLLYVALTRPKNYLTIVGTTNVQNLTQIKNQFDIKLANSYLNYICGGLNQSELDVLVSNKKHKKVIDDFAINFEIMEQEDISQFSNDTISEQEQKLEKCDNFEQIINKKFFHSTLSKKSSVSQIMQDEEHYNISNFSAYKSDQKTEDDFLAIGTLYHKIMQFVNFTDDKQNIESQIEELIKRKIINETDFQIVDKQKIIVAIFEINKFLQKDDILLKEQPFLCCMPANQLINTTEQSKILVQGVADLIIIKKNEILLVDYKTSRLKNLSDFEKKYSTQLDIYAKAIQDFYQKPVTKKLIYSFYLDKLLTI